MDLGKVFVSTHEFVVCIAQVWRQNLIWFLLKILKIKRYWILFQQNIFFGH